MFSRWGAFVYRHRRIVLVLAIVVGMAGATGAGRAASVLSAGGWLDPNSESAAVGDRLAAEFGAGRGALVALFQGPGRRRRPEPAVPGDDRALPRGPGEGPDVAGTIGFAQTGDARFISTDGHAAYVVVDLNVTDEQSVPLLARFESRADGTGRRDQAAARRVRAAHPGLGQAVRARPRAGRDRLAPDRRASC